MREGSDYVRLARMEEQCQLIIESLQGKRYEDFVNDRNFYDATVMRLFVLGENAGSLSETTQIMAPGVEWHKIRGLRNIIAHGYYDLSVERVWEVAYNHISILKPEVSRLKQLTPKPSLG